jgi:hypothetical protein
MKQQLIEAIHTLANELVKNGKAKTGDYFFHAESKIASECEGNQQELLDLLEQLQRSGSIIQYANLNATEEGLWDKVYDLSKTWRATMT